jgi:3-hydroxyacyl-[acyl-carrier-protein] dehydratase
MLDARQIMAIIPHRYPILMVDRIIEIEPGKRAVGIKNVSANEPVFQGHYPGYPILPGVLILEALAQTGAVALMMMEEFKGKVPLFAGLGETRFRKPVVPGDQLRLEVEIFRMRGPLGIGAGRAYVGDQLAAETELKFAFADAQALG